MARFRLLLIVLPVLFMSATAHAEALKITASRAPVLMIWADTEGTALVKEIPAGQVALPVAVESVSKNLMLKATVDGRTGWIFGHHVKTNKKPELSAGCDETLASQDLGATRGLGEGCD